MGTIKEIGFIPGLCLIGIMGVCYGMVKENHLAFVGGLVFVIVAYLMLRKRLKKSLREKYPSE